MDATQQGLERSIQAKLAEVVYARRAQESSEENAMLAQSLSGAMTKPWPNSLPF
jgi:hypothetical protein